MKFSAEIYDENSFIVVPFLKNMGVYCLGACHIKTMELRINGVWAEAIARAKSILNLRMLTGYVYLVESLVHDSKSYVKILECNNYHDKKLA